MNMSTKAISAVLVLGLMNQVSAPACTTILVTKGASADG